MTDYVFVCCMLLCRNDITHPTLHLQCTMSSSGGAGNQVYPQSMSRTGEKLPHMAKPLQGTDNVIKGSECENHRKASDSNAWQSNIRSKSLGRIANVQTYTGGFSSEEDSDCEADSSSALRSTRSLGRNEMNALLFGVRGSASKIVPVSERSAAYKEMITQNTSKLSPRHSVVKVSDGLSSNRSKIESNPFFQQDKHAKLSGESEPKRKISPAAVKNAPAVGKAASPVTDGSSILGMSVQMRIKMWSEKEQKSDKEVKVTHRRSLQPSALLTVHSNTADMKAEAEDVKRENTAHSDDEMIKSKMNVADAHPARENFYEEINDEVAHRIKEASSSSDASPTNSPSKKATKKRLKEFKEFKEITEIVQEKG